MQQMYNLEYRILDKLGRTKKTFHGGIYSTEDKLNQGKQRIEEEHKEHKIAFDVYILNRPLFT